MRWIYESLSSLEIDFQYISVFALTVLAMSVLNRLITFPLTMKQANNSKKMQSFQPKLAELEKKYAYDERILQQKKMEFYKENNLSQVGCASCLPMVIQLIAVLGLMGVMRNPELYLFDDASMLDTISKNFFWISDLTKPDVWYGLPLIYTASMILVTKFNPASKQSEATGMGSMMYIMPIAFFFLTIRWASAVVLYWTFGNILELIIRGILALVTKKEK